MAHTGGAKKKFTEIKQKQYLEYLYQGHSKQMACKLVGIDSSTLYNFHRQNPDFRPREAEAMIGIVDSVENTLLEKAREGESWAVTFYLKHNAQVYKQNTKLVIENNTSTQITPDMQKIIDNNKGILEKEEENENEK
jgi:hypothetical protein